ncbi:MAG: type II toxin-antitoxin system VapC family toxin [Planctomycetota bacterium]
MIVLDASVILKWILRDEAGAADALVWRERHCSGLERVAVPDLLFYEVANGMLFSGRLSEQDAAESWEALLAVELEVYAVWADAMPRVLEVARAGRTTAYDASYAVLAEALGCEFRTADRRLARKLEALDLGCAVRLL